MRDRLNRVQTDAFNQQNRTTGTSEITPLPGRDADMPTSTQMTHMRHSLFASEEINPIRASLGRAFPACLATVTVFAYTS